MAQTKRDAPAAPTIAKNSIFLAPGVRRNLGLSIAYHQQMADAAKEEDNEKLAATHLDAAQQLQQLLDASPVINAVDVAMTATRPLRRAVLH
jgi:hypothetical protein